MRDTVPMASGHLDPFTTDPATTDRRLGPHTWALIGDHGGRYPAGNSVLVRGADATVLVDPSTSVSAAGGAIVKGAACRVDHIVLTHVHEDHVAGVHLFPEATVAAHAEDALGIRSLDGLMTMYGMDPEAEADFRRTIVDDFTYVARPDARAFADGEVIDLGGVTIRVIHLPGHTRGHCGLLIEPDGVLVLGDIDLTAFGPYYGDAWSDLDAFVTSLGRAREIDARWYVTFHHRGVVDGRAELLPLLDAFSAVIDDREDRMVEHLAAAPRTLEDLVAHRFVYRPHVRLPFVDTVERRSASMSLRRLVGAGRVTEVAPGTYAAS